ncbi:Sadenosylmethionine mitochondrial carrier protein pu [Baffinella frigidus]|nr:Sadenosylmethionine mitochondrial carrier protein pu [Cryptophyta sp. CCMP2293]
MQQQKAREKQRLELSYTIALLAGGCAGTAVDVTLFPIDTIKTRMQAPCGFRAAGGFGSVYRGLLGAACGSAPGAALFFSTYERVKDALMEGADEEVRTHALTSEVFTVDPSCACLVRVAPVDFSQPVNFSHLSTFHTLSTFQGWRGFYVGYGSTIMREIPFSFIQFPIYETLKKRGAQHRGRALQPFESALCGSVGGGVSAAITTPFDVIKTHLMIGRDRQGVPYTGWRSAVLRIYQSGGAKMFFRGIVPRTVWIALGGCVFFGCANYP